MKSQIDSQIIDLIMDHFNIQSLGGLNQILSSEDFDEIVKIAEKMYYERIMNDTPVGIEGEA
tara:strand:- start:247 stop:432 length:186 start_codon:yes stop_codon:yes gene_type:complete